MSLYAESSAVLAWLLGEAPGLGAARALERSDLVVASELTLIDCDRAMIRCVSSGIFGESDRAARCAQLRSVAANWNILRMSAEVIDRARQPFPHEPLRTLDAIHFASVLFARAAIPELDLLSLDTRVRKSAVSLGLRVVPS